ncbi:MAG TPA: hypothetical protein VFL27_08435 [Candidatus Dormibacteraeota bacterium]|nr:hypothetical protein [Candidatus Dormibacteraeota bacterium]
MAGLPKLEWLDYRGGSGDTADVVRGCSGLRFLWINQVRGLHDLTALSDLRSLELLVLYGLPQVKAIPSLSRAANLRRAEIGSMKGLAGLGGLLDAPHLEELVLMNRVSVADGDASRVAAHPSIRAFWWSGDDVPVKTSEEFERRVGKPRVQVIGAQDWAAARPP